MSAKPTITEIFNCGSYFEWAWTGFGHGQLSFGLNKDGELTCMNECMSRETVREIMIAFANHVADNVKLLEPPRGDAE